MATVAFTKYKIPVCYFCSDITKAIIIFVIIL